MVSFHIRPATPQDVKAILELITDLVSSFILKTTSPNFTHQKAIYEKEPDAVKATPDLVSYFCSTSYRSDPRSIANQKLVRNPVRECVARLFRICRCSR